MRGGIRLEVPVDQQFGTTRPHFGEGEALPVAQPVFAQVRVFLHGQAVVARYGLRGDTGALQVRGNDSIDVF